MGMRDGTWYVHMRDMVLQPIEQAKHACMHGWKGIRPKALKLWEQGLSPSLPKPKSTKEAPPIGITRPTSLSLSLARPEFTRPKFTKPEFTSAGAKDLDRRF